MTVFQLCKSNLEAGTARQSRENITRRIPGPGCPRVEMQFRAFRMLLFVIEWLANICVRRGMHIAVAAIRLI